MKSITKVFFLGFSLCFFISSVTQILAQSQPSQGDSCGGGFGTWEWRCESGAYVCYDDGDGAGPLCSPGNTPGYICCVPPH